ncbi:hypothetical protein [Acidovorax sp. sic0104]|uniref:hypothetical protein n=1 Tax=Acidovorax sp. sic0104 TaxID=2854784 RepID=UPI001C465850|nr:hypothetical protein [Acidovorax sp. sic0104]MBV7539790.1 hypothetical protein [Acidovorax sp. sic0104]
MMARELRGIAAHPWQRGVSLLFALLALVVLSLASLGLVRSVDTGLLVQGNLGFKQDGIAAAAAGAEDALKWLELQTSNSLEISMPAYGYFASSHEALDLTGNKTSSTNPLPGVKWSDSCEPSASECLTPFTSDKTVNDNKVQWIITRLCANEGSPTAAATNCLRPPKVIDYEVSERGEINPGGRLTLESTSPYFRVVVRTTGPRNTVTYTETLVHF